MNKQEKRKLIRDFIDWMKKDEYFFCFYDDFDRGEDAFKELLDFEIEQEIIKFLGERKEK